MAQSLYQTSPSNSYKFKHSVLRYATQMPDQTSKSGSMQLAPMPQNMNSGGHRPKQRMSRLETMKKDYQKKLLKEKEDKLSKYYANREKEARKTNSGGTVREFFAERRALEAQYNSSALPPIQQHFEKVKEQRQQGFSPQKHRGMSQQQEPTRPIGYSTNSRQTRLPNQQTPPYQNAKTLPKMTTSTGSTRRNIQRNAYQGPKRTKGIDKQDPLPPLHKSAGKNSDKPPTPNNRYETYSDLRHSDQYEESNEVYTHVPTPPAKAKPAFRRPKAPLRPVSNGAQSDGAESSSTCTDNAPPNLRRLKEKALLQKHLSQQKLNTELSQQGKVELSDFQKWQVEQDKARQERLDRFKRETVREQTSDGEHEDGEPESSDLAHREQELLEKIRQEQARLEKLQHQRQKLEDQEKQEKEEEEQWRLESEKRRMTSSIEEEKISPSPVTQKKNPSRVKPKERKPQNQIYEETRNETPGEVEEMPSDDFQNFYAEAAAKAKQTEVAVTPCSICGRSFASDRVARHTKICAKNSKAQRKVFDSTKHRARGTEFEQYVLNGKHKEEPEKKVSLATLLAVAIIDCVASFQ